MLVEGTSSEHEIISVLFQAILGDRSSQVWTVTIIMSPRQRSLSGSVGRRSALPSGITMTSLVLDQICKRFNTHEVLNNVNLSLETGERVAITGESGSGKTTLLRVIAGLEQPTSGRVRLLSQDVTTWPANRRSIGMVFQDYATYPRMTVAENLTVSLVGNSITKAEKEARLHEIAGWLGLESLLRRLPSELSGGQLQRVALGKALMARPKFLLLDEPFSQLDVRLTEQLRRLLNESHQRFGMTQIMVTHQPLDALCSVDKLAILDRGQLVQFGPPDEIRQRPNTRFAAELTSPCGLNVIPPHNLAQLNLPRSLPGQATLLGQASVAFRPETVHIATNSESAVADGALSFRCRLGTIHELGVVRLQEAFLGDHKILILSPDATTRPMGEEVLCTVRREDMLIFPA